jgi:hypothetical protein
MEASHRDSIGAHFSGAANSTVKIIPKMIVDQIIADAPDDRWLEFQSLCGEHKILQPLRPLVRKAAPTTDDG